MKLPLSENIYRALKVEAGEELRSRVELSYRRGMIEIRIKAQNLTSLQAALNAWLRMCKTLKKVEEVVECRERN